MKTDRLLKAISDSAAPLFRDRNLDRACHGLIRRLGEAAGVSRVYYFENGRGPRGGLFTSQRLEWVAPGISRQIDNPRMLHLPLSRIRFLADRMRRGPYHGLVCRMPPSIRAILGAQKILSLALVPVRVESEWHGFLGFDDCMAPRRWSKSELGILQAAAGILGGAIERRRIEERLRSVLECGIDSLDAGIFILNPECRVIWMNRAMERFFGVGRERVLGGDYRRFVRRGLRGVVANPAQFRRCVAQGRGGGGRVQTFRCEVLPGAGRQPRVLQYRCIPIRRGALAGGRIEQYTDVTAVERAHAALKGSEEKYRDLVERMNEGVCHSDERRVIRYANRCFYRMFGYASGELIGRTEESFLDAGGMRIYRREQRRRRRGEATRYEVRIRARSGEMVPVLVSAVPAVDKGGRFRGSYAVFTDLRAQKRLEVLKEEILRDASHELKAPAAKIRMGLDLVKRCRPEPLNDEERLGISMIESGVARIRKNVDSLIDFSAFDSGVVVLSRAAVDLGSLLANLAAEFSAVAARKSLALVVEPYAPGLRLSGDRDRLYHLFRNLLENAVNCSQAGSIRILARHSGREVVVSVADEGRGIESGYLERIFDRHFQRYPSEAGTGIGLTLCRKIAQLHGGRIWAESGGRGKGMTVHVALPVRASRR